MSIGVHKNPLVNYSTNQKCTYKQEVNKKGTLTLKKLGAQGLSVDFAVGIEERLALRAVLVFVGNHGIHCCGG